jgi:hypothetical protein
MTANVAGPNTAVKTRSHRIPVVQSWMTRIGLAGFGLLIFTTGAHATEVRTQIVFDAA